MIRWLDKTSFTFAGSAPDFTITVRDTISWNVYYYDILEILKHQGYDSFIIPQVPKRDSKEIVTINMEDCNSDLSQYIADNGLDDDLINEVIILTKDGRLKINESDWLKFCKLLPFETLNRIYQDKTIPNHWLDGVFQANRNIDPDRRDGEAKRDIVRQTANGIQHSGHDEQRAFLGSLLEVMNSNYQINAGELDTTLAHLSLNLRIEFYPKFSDHETIATVIYKSAPADVDAERHLQDIQRQEEKERMRNEQRLARKRKRAQEAAARQHGIPCGTINFFNTPPNDEIDWNHLTAKQKRFNILLGRKGVQIQIPVMKNPLNMGSLIQNIIKS